jgi:hypothetical protein
MVPDFSANGGRPSKGLYPINNKDAGGGKGGYNASGAIRPASEVGTGQTPPTTKGGRVPRSGTVGNYISGGRGGEPVKGPGVFPATGASRRPAPVTGPNDKSKNAGVE